MITAPGSMSCSPAGKPYSVLTAEHGEPGMAIERMDVLHHGGRVGDQMQRRPVV